MEVAVKPFPVLTLVFLASTGYLRYEDVIILYWCFNIDIILGS